MYTWLKKNIGIIYYIIPYLNSVKNKYQLICSLLLQKKQFRVELINDISVLLKREKIGVLIALLGVTSFATSVSKKNESEIEIILDMKNKFVINIDKMSVIDEKLLELLYEGSLYGASFIANDDDRFVVNGKTIKIAELEGEKIIEVVDGRKFYLDSITPGIIVETYVQKIHNISLMEDFNGKIVVDVGAECGDTAIYYANKGAKVYAFEPVRAHYSAMLRNIGLNPELAKNIVPINAGIGKDGMLKFYQSDRSEIAEAASFVYNIHGEHVKTSEIKGYSLKSAFTEYGLKHIDLLKMDCKGCDYFLVEDDLRNIDSLKIEYLNYDNSHKLEDLLAKIKHAGFHYIIYRHIPTYYSSNLFAATLYAKKISN